MKKILILLTFVVSVFMHSAVKVIPEARLDNITESVIKEKYEELDVEEGLMDTEQLNDLGIPVEKGHYAFVYKYEGFNSIDRAFELAEKGLKMLTKDKYSPLYYGVFIYEINYNDNMYDAIGIFVVMTKGEIKYPEYYVEPENNNDSISQNNSGSYLFPSNTEYITDNFLAGKDLKTLGYIRNEIYARHGYVFNNKDYQNYFASTDWYTPNPNFSENLFNNIEKANVKKVQEYEKRLKNGGNSSSSTNQSYNVFIFPTNTTYITEAILNGYNKTEVALIRNEIYARHGYVFKNKDYKNYFGSMSWYRQNQNFTENLFNNIEKENLKRIRAYEKNRGW